MTMWPIFYFFNDRCCTNLSRSVSVLLYDWRSVLKQRNHILVQVALRIAFLHVFVIFSIKNSMLFFLFIIGQNSSGIWWDFCHHLMGVIPGNRLSRMSSVLLSVSWAQTLLTWEQTLGRLWGLMFIQKENVFPTNLVKTCLEYYKSALCSCEIIKLALFFYISGIVSDLTRNCFRRFFSLSQS